MSPRPTFSIRRCGHDPGKWTLPFKVMLSRNWEPREYVTCTHYFSYTAQNGDYVTVATVEPCDTYKLIVASGQECCLDYGRIAVQGARPAP